MQTTYITKFLNALFILDTASLEPSEVEVRSISLIISKTHFFHCFLFLPGILHLFHSFQNFFTAENYPYLFSIISKTKLLFSYFSLNLKAQYLNHPIQLHCKSLRSNLKSNAHTLFNYDRFRAEFAYAEVYAFKITSL